MREREREGKEGRKGRGEEGRRGARLNHLEETEIKIVLQSQKRSAFFVLLLVFLFDVKCALVFTTTFQKKPEEKNGSEVYKRRKEEGSRYVHSSVPAEGRKEGKNAGGTTYTIKLHFLQRTVKIEGKNKINLSR